MLVCSFSPNNGEVESGGSLEPTASKSSLLGEYQVNNKPHLTKQGGQHSRNDPCSFPTTAKWTYTYQTHISPTCSLAHMKKHTCEHTHPNISGFFKTWNSFLHFLALCMSDSLEVSLFNYMFVPRQPTPSFFQSDSYLKWALRQVRMMQMCPFETHRDRFILLVNCLPGSQGGGGEERDQPSHIQVRLQSSFWHTVCNINFVC